MPMFLPDGAVDNAALIAAANTQPGGLRGLKRDLPEAQYHALPFASKSGMTAFARSPAYYHHWKTNQREPTPAMILGAATHCGLLEWATFHTRYAPMDESIYRRTKEGKAKWASWLEEHAGKIPLRSEQWAKIKAMRESLLSAPLGRTLFEPTDAHNEISCFWSDPIQGVQFKSRVDRLDMTREFVLDLKTCTNARQWDFESSIFKYKYHWQPAIYLDGLEYGAGIKLKDFLFVAIESEAPFDWMVYRMKDDVVQRARDEYRSHLPLFDHCITREVFPGYSKEIQDIGLPSYADYR